MPFIYLFYQQGRNNNNNSNSIQSLSNCLVLRARTTMHQLHILCQHVTCECLSRPSFRVDWQCNTCRSIDHVMCDSMWDTNVCATERRTQPRLIIGKNNKLDDRRCFIRYHGWNANPYPVIRPFVGPAPHWPLDSLPARYTSENRTR